MADEPTFTRDQAARALAVSTAAELLTTTDSSGEQVRPFPEDVTALAEYILTGTQPAPSPERLRTVAG